MMMNLSCCFFEASGILVNHCYLSPEMPLPDCNGFVVILTYIENNTEMDNCKQMC